MRVLLSESASLTARETLTVLGPQAVEIDVLKSGSLTLGRFSRWTRELIPAPTAAADPLGYLRVVRDLAASGRYDAVLPTHEHAWLFAAAAHLLPAAPIAVAPLPAFGRVHSKIDFAGLLDELELPQPRWWISRERPVDAGFPHWVKASHGHSGRTVRLVTNEVEERRAIAELGAVDEVMGQAPAPGQYGQVQAVFDHGRLIGVHTSVQIGTGAGGSAAARLSVDHPAARDYVARIGAHLEWHGGLTLDYFHVDGRPQFIEANVRTVEPGNAALSGVDLPRLMIELSAGRSPAGCIVGRAGVRSRSGLALAIGAAEREVSRRGVIHAVAPLARRTGEIGAAAEVLTPVLRDPLSAIPVAFVLGQLLADPCRVGALATSASASYGVTSAAIEQVRAAVTL